jgi:hypothetical protein
MADCRECDSSMPDSANFCPSCGAPQNEDAARALEKYIQRQVDDLPDGNNGATGGDSPLADRLSYALGWVTVVGGLAILPEPSSGFLVFGGIIALPPMRRLVGRVLGFTPDARSMLVVSLSSIVFGLGLFFLA